MSKERALNQDIRERLAARIEKLNNEKLADFLKNMNFKKQEKFSFVKKPQELPKTEIKKENKKENKFSFIKKEVNLEKKEGLVTTVEQNNKEIIDLDDIFDCVPLEKETKIEQKQEEKKGKDLDLLLNIDFGKDLLN